MRALEDVSRDLRMIRNNGSESLDELLKLDKVLLDLSLYSQYLPDARELIHRKIEIEKNKNIKFFKGLKEKSNIVSHFNNFSKVLKESITNRLNFIANSLRERPEVYPYIDEIPYLLYYIKSLGLKRDPFITDLFKKYPVRKPQLDQILVYYPLFQELLIYRDFDTTSLDTIESLILGEKVHLSPDLRMIAKEGNFEKILFYKHPGLSYEHFIRIYPHLASEGLMNMWNNCNSIETFSFKIPL